MNRDDVPRATDAHTPVDQLKQWVRQFVDERDWNRFHAPKNLAMALAVEAAELMEHFLWIDPEESRRVLENPQKLADVGEELADVLCFALALANQLELDVTSTVRAKMEKNRQKYPAQEYRGRYGPEDPGTPAAAETRRP